MSITTDSVRLSNAWKPTSYRLDVSVHLEDWAYETTQTITLTHGNADDGSATSSPPAHTVTLHAAASEILSVTGAEVVSRDAARSLIVFSWEANNQTHDTKIKVFTVRYRSSMSEELRGFYRVKYQAADGTALRMAATHFEPTGARTFYICLDEPAARADFDMVVRLPAATGTTAPMVLSNGMLVGGKPVRSDDAMFDVYTFSTVPAIPPYLTALVVGDLECLEAKACGGRVPVRFFTTKGKSSRAKFSLDAAVFSLELFESFFGCVYPLPKLDLVAIPDFPIGGMENWGCICLVESTLIDGASSSIKTKKAVSNLVCHEVSHNWFGNLVGIDWWEGLWLKEGFASWCGFYATSKWQPTWNAMEDATLDVQDALFVDMHEGTHPVEVPISDPALITQIFDSISYDKGMAVVMQLQNFLGPQKFQVGIQAYMQRYKYRSTTTRQLWETLEEVTATPHIAAVMSTFTMAPGYPLISASKTEGKDGGHALEIRQERCQLHAPGRNTDLHQQEEFLWSVPLVVQFGLSASSNSISQILVEKSATIPIPSGLSDTTLIKLNPLHFGFYRCRYDKSLMHDILHSYHKLPSQDRRGVISDVFAAVYSTSGNGEEALNTALQLMDKVTQAERDATVLETYVHCVHELADSFEGATNADDLVDLILEAGLSPFMPFAAESSVQDPKTLTPVQSQLRGLYVSEALKLLRRRGDSDSQLVQWAIKGAQQYLNSSSTQSDDPDVLPAVLSTAVRFLPLEDSKDTLWNKLQMCQDDADASRALLRALCEVRDAAYVQGLVTRAASGDSTIVRSQYGHVLYMSAAHNSVAGKTLWSYFKQNYDQVFRQWGQGQFRIQSIVDSVGGTLSKADEAADWDIFFATHPIPNASLSIKRASEGIHLRHWLQSTHTRHLASRLMKRK